MDLHKKSEQLLEELNNIELNSDTIQHRAYHSIQVCSNLLNTFKKEVTSAGFDAIGDEINFFKNIKQIPLVPLIYYSEIHSFEIQFPKADKTAQIKFIKKRIKKLNRFFLFNMDYIQYVNSGQTHFDREYYTRDYLEHFHITTSKFYFQDPEFCTPRDMLLGKFKAFNSLVTYMNKRLSDVQNKKIESKTLSNDEKIPWPFTNTDWVELVYALSAAAKAKQVDLKITQISNKLEQVFDHKPRKPYKTYQDMKARKNSRTSFLDLLETTLISEMNKSDE